MQNKMSVNLKVLYCCFLLFHTCVFGQNSLAVVPLSHTSNNDEDKNDDNLVAEVSIEDEISTEQQFEPFIPTNEWQTVSPGQRIPVGLHVRMDLQTGKKEAKFLDKSQPQEDSVKFGDSVYRVQELKDTLKNIKAETFSSENQEKRSQKWRSYEDLKKELSMDDIDVKSDAEIMRHLMDEYKVAGEEQRVEILAELEYHVHQIDNGINFVDMGGLEMIKLAALNSTNSMLRLNALHLLGSAAQCNSKVQIAAVNEGIFDRLLGSLSSENDPNMRKKQLFAVSSLMRHFPHAQKIFLDWGGVQILVSVLASTQTTDLSSKKRVLALINDLLAERVNHLEHIEEANQNREQQQQQQREEDKKFAQYSEIPLRNAFIDAGLCARLPPVLNDMTDIDGKQKAIELWALIGNHCLDTIAKSRSQLTDLRDQFSKSLQLDSEDELLIHLVRSVESILSLLSATTTATIEL